MPVFSMKILDEQMGYLPEPEHGMKTIMFKERPAIVADRFAKFVAKQSAKYPDTFEIVSQSQSTFPAGIVLNVVYKY